MKSMEVRGQRKHRRSKSHSKRVAIEAPSKADDAVESSDDDVTEIVKCKLLSPYGGQSTAFTMLKGRANRDVQEELHAHISNIFNLGVGIKEAFEKKHQMFWEDLPWSDAEKVPALFASLNRCIRSVTSMWSKVEKSAWQRLPVCTLEQALKLSYMIFNRAVKNAHVLNKCYQSFSSQTYGETSFDQIQIIMDYLHMTDKDVFVDLGSGVGQVVTFAAAYTMAKKCIGIEINDVPAGMADCMAKEFKELMSWYGKAHRPFALVHGDFTTDAHKELIQKEATVIYLNNYAYDAQLMLTFREMVYGMADGTRIICTKSLYEERLGAEGLPRRITSRAIYRPTVDMMLDCDELPIAENPVSWSTGKDIKFYCFTVNMKKMEKVYEIAAGRQPNGTVSLQSKSADSTPTVPIDELMAQLQIEAIRERVVKARPITIAGGARSIRMYPDEDESDDEGEGEEKKGEKKEEKKEEGEGEEHAQKSEGTTERFVKEEDLSKPSGRRARQNEADAKAKAIEEAKALANMVVKKEKEDGVLGHSNHRKSSSKGVRPHKKSANGEVEGAPKPKKRRLNGEVKKEEGVEEKMEEEEEQKPEEVFPYGKVAALGHTDDFDKESAPEWAAKVAKDYVAVYAPHHSIFEEDLTNLPPRRSMAAAVVPKKE